MSEGSSEELRRARDRAQQYLDVAGVMLLSLDAAGRVTMINRRGCRIMEYEEGELVGQSWFDTCVPEPSRREVADLFRRMIAGETPLVEAHENTVVTKSGRMRLIAWHNALVRGAQGEVVGTLSSGEDITEHRRWEDERVRLAAAVEQTSEFVIMTDARGRITYVNAAFERITGYDRGDVLGRTHPENSGNGRATPLYREIQNAVARGGTWTGRLSDRRKDGTAFESEAIVFPIRDGAGRVINYAAISRDITHELMLEKQLREAQKMEAVGQLAGGIAHDFNNLLMIILNSAQFIKDRLPPTSPSLTDVAAIVDATRRAAVLTRQLLAFSRRQTLVRRPTDLNQVIGRVERMVRRMLDPRIRLTVVLAPSPCSADIDAGQIEQAVLHLALNARDAMSGQGQLTIQTASVTLSDGDIAQLTEPAESAAGVYAVVSLSDTGGGMDPEVQSHIFEPFFTTKEFGHGTGLGLSSVYGVVKQHGGHIHVYSEPGKGTTFKVYLPLSGSASSPPAAAGAAIPHGRGIVLLAEDDPDVRRLAARMLRELDYTVVEAAGGTQALDMVRQQDMRFDVLVSDMFMADMNGKALAGEVRRLRPGTPILFVSGYPEAHLMQQGILDTGDVLLEKPFVLADVAAKVQSVLDVRPAVRGSPAI